MKQERQITQSKSYGAPSGPVVLVVPQARDHREHLPIKNKPHGRRMMYGTSAFKASILARQLLVRSKVLGLTFDEMVGLEEIVIGGRKCRNGLARVKALILRLNVQGITDGDS